MCLRRGALRKLCLAMTPLLIMLLQACSLLNPQPTPEQRAEYLEPMLSAAGFRVISAQDPSKLQTLNSLPALRVNYYFDKNGEPHYWFADPYVCKCLYLGDQTAYQHYENLRLQARIARQQEEAAEENMEASQNMQMEMMSPFGFGFGPGLGIGF